MITIRQILGAFLALFCLSGFAAESERLISLKQDFEGAGGRTWELILKPDGSIVEELWNLHARSVSEVEIVKTIRIVPREQISQLVFNASELIKGLPKYINTSETTTVDPKTKAIRVTREGKELFVGWSSYEDLSHTEKAAEFERSWNSIKKLLLGASA